MSQGPADLHVFKFLSVPFSAFYRYLFLPDHHYFLIVPKFFLLLFKMDLI